MDSNTFSTIFMLKRRKVLFGISLLILFLLLSSILLTPLLWRNSSLAQYQDYRVTRTDLNIKVNASGLLQSSVYNLAFKSPGGTLAEILVKQGQTIKKGQILGRLDQTTLQDAVNVAKKAVEAAENNLQAALRNANVSADYIDALIDAAEADFRSEDNTYKAVREQSRENIDATEDITKKDEEVLREVREFAQDLMKEAKAVYDKNVFDCQDNPRVFSVCHSKAKAEYERSVSFAKVEVLRAEAQVNRDEQDEDRARSNGKAYNTTAKGEADAAESRIDVAENNPAFTSANTQVVNARGQLEVAYAQLKAAQNNLTNTTLIAPSDGVITAVNGTIGSPPGIPANIAPPGPSSAPYGIFVQLVDLKTVREILANVSEADIANIKAGQDVQFTLKAFGTRQFKGKVNVISPNGINGPGGIIFPVIIDIDSQSTQGVTVLPNMTANIVIPIVQQTQALSVPLSAVNFGPGLNPPNTGGTGGLVNQEEATNALATARVMASNIKKALPVVNQQPTPAFIVQRGTAPNTYTALPIVLGITDGNFYQVLEGLSDDDQIMVGTPPATGSTPAP